MGHVSVDLRLMSSIWAVLSKLTTSVFTIVGRTNPGLGSGEEAPQCDNNQGWPPSVNQQSIHQPIDSCGQDPAWVLGGIQR